jgi:cytoskeleton protein RodZ
MTQEEHLSNVGLYLRHCRRSSGISIEQVAAQTKIRVVVLRQIESGDLKQVPSTYVKGFIKVFAETVGADVDEALRLFAKNHTISSQTEQSLASPPQTSPSVWPRLLAALIVLAILIAATVFLADRFRTQPAETAQPPGETGEMTPVRESTAAQAPQAHQTFTGEDAEKAVEDRLPAADMPVTAEEPQAPAVVPEPALPPLSAEPAVQTQVAEPAVQAQVAEGAVQAQVAEEAGQPAPYRDLTLQLDAIERTWMRITRDDGAPREYTMNPDERMTLEAQSRFELLIGNAGGVRLKLNDEPVPISGASGRVVRLRLP